MPEIPTDWKAFLINLPDRRDRLRVAQDELAKIGWHIGSTGVNLFPARRFTERSGFPSPSIRGAFWSHYGCLMSALSQRTGSVLLLEDDISFARSFPKLLPSLRSQLETAAWDLCYFGHEDTGRISRANESTEAVRLIPYGGAIIGLHFCLVRCRILPRLLGHLDRVASGSEGDPEYGPMPIDGAFNTFRRLNPDVTTLIANPKVGWQRPSRSDITPRLIDQITFLRPTVALLRKLKDGVDSWRSG